MLRARFNKFIKAS